LLTVVPVTAPYNDPAPDLRELPRHLRRSSQRILEAALDYDLTGLSQEQLLESFSSTIPALALAAAAEAAQRTLGLRAYPEQLVATHLLSEHYIVEMDTGEGKTLAASMAAALIARHVHVHVATANDYLAARDAAYTKDFYGYLGLRVGVTSNQITVEEKKVAYDSEIVYSTISQFAFDYLADHLAADPERRVQTKHQSVIVDEADSVMIDEARTPLIMSGAPLAESPQGHWAQFVRELAPYHYEELKENRQVWLTPSGIRAAEAFAKVPNLYDNPRLAGLAHAALIAEVIYKRDRDYLVTEDEPPLVVIIDEGTGRVMPGRRWQDGIHEAVEAKEGLNVRPPVPTVATTSVPAYLDLYENVAGTSGSVVAATDEFAHLYDKEVISVPRHLPLDRLDHPERIFLHSGDKHDAIVSLVTELNQSRRPVLIGTPSVQEAHALSDLFTERGLAHELLSARRHLQEAQIIARAGVPGAITIATNMAGRGVDILLGGNPEDSQISPEALAEAREATIASGGLVVIATARHSSQRIDVQLRGRSARQGEPGETFTFLSCDDDLLSDVKNSRLFDLIRTQAGEHGYATSSLVTKLVNDIQQRVEMSHEAERTNARNYERHAAAQRTEVYRYRDQILDSDWVENIRHWCALAADYDVLEDRLWPFYGDPVINAATSEVAYEVEAPEEDDEDIIFIEDIPEVDVEGITKEVTDTFRANSDQISDEARDHVVRYLLTTTLDASWQNHLVSIDTLRDGTALRRTAGDPIAQFSRDVHKLFERMLTRMLALGLGKILDVTATPSPLASTDAPNSATTTT
jgi:preprotein translocase subunit SecA